MKTKRIKVDYEGEQGIDAGGLSKDWFLHLSVLLISEASSLLLPGSHPATISKAESGWTYHLRSMRAS